MGANLSALTQTPVGRIAYHPFQWMIHFARRRMHPGVPLDHRIIKASYGQRHFPIEVRRWNPADRLAVEQCFTEAQYDVISGAHAVYLGEVYREIVASGRKPLIVDCGANIGASVLWFSARYPEAHIVAIEPSPHNFALLSRNCRGLDVDLRHAGVGGADGTAWVDDPHGQRSMGCRTNLNHDGFEVEILSPATMLAGKRAAEYTPFLLKVDIEGAEQSLFTAPAEDLDRFPLILVEPHDWMLPGQQTSVAFFRFHAQAGREFAMKHENIASIAYHVNVDGGQCG